MSFSFTSNIPAPQLVCGYPFGLHNSSPNFPTSFSRYGAPTLAPYHAKPPRFLSSENVFPPRATSTARHLVPRDMLEQRARTPCKHFEHHLGWCPYGTECHFLHDYSRLPPSRGPSISPSLTSPSESATSSLRSSPVSSGPYYHPGAAPYQVGFTAPPPRVPRVLHHDFTPRNIGGTTYFPIRLGDARLGYVTPTGVEVFTDQ